MGGHDGEGARRARRWWVVGLTVGAAAIGSVWLAPWRGGAGGRAVDGGAVTTVRDAATSVREPPREAPASTTPPPAPPGAADQAALDSLSLRLEPVVELRHPTAVAERPRTGDLYVTGLEGSVVRVAMTGGAPVPVADLSSRISTSGESGLLDLAFDATGAVVFLSMVESDGDLALVEVPVTPAGGFTVDRGRALLTIESPSNVHHAGDVDVDARGLVWFAVGDGGPSQGRSRRAQDLTDLHGKILRIDPRPAGGAPYQVPADNPFHGRPDARPEIWAYGLRNPWRFDVDPVTGDLWVADVGRNGREELDHRPGPRAGAGDNFGWPYFEGSVAGLADPPAELVAPLLDYAHGERCGITGGSVYRGSAIPALTGAYLYSDLCDGVVRAVTVKGGTVIGQRAFESAQTGYPVSFGTDLAGEAYLCSFDFGAVYRIVPG